MSEPARARALRGLLRLGGVVGVGAGLDTLLRGARSLPGKPDANAAVDSELRFFAPFYGAYGLAVWRVAARADRDAEAVRAVAAPLFLAGLGRLAAWAQVGRPNRGQLGLLAIELAAPPLVIAWQRRLAAQPAPAQPQTV